MAQQSPRMVAAIIWAAFLAGVTLFLGVALFLVVGLGGGQGLARTVDGPLLLAISAALSIVTIAISWRWAVRMKRPPSAGVTPLGGALPPGPEAHAVGRLVVAGALCEFGALFAALVFLLTGNLIALVPFAASWLALAAHFPGDRHWAQLVGTARGAGAGSNRMIRG